MRIKNLITLKLDYHIRKSLKKDAYHKEYIFPEFSFTLILNNTSLYYQQDFIKFS